MRLHHVQMMMPPNGDESARAFWRDAVGLTEVPKPPAMADRPGCWFRGFNADGSVGVEIHVSVAEPFVPSHRAHPAIELDAAQQLDPLGERIEAAGFEVSREDRHNFEGYLRFHCFDGFGNRVEVLAPAD